MSKASSVISIIYLVILILAITILFIYGFFKFKAPSNNPLTGPNGPDYQELINKFQNDGALVTVNDYSYPSGSTAPVLDPRLQFNKYELGLGKTTGTPPFLFATVPAHLDPAASLDLLTPVPVFPGDCYYSDQIIAQRVTKVCTELSGCYPKIKYGESFSYYQTDPTGTYNQCSQDGTSFGVIRIGTNCLAYNPLSLRVDTADCDPGDSNQLWVVSRFNTDSTPSDNGLIGQVQLRTFQISGNTAIIGNTGLTGCLSANSNDTLSLSNCGINWGFNPSFIVSVSTGTPNNKTTFNVSVPNQLAWIKDASLTGISNLETFIKNNNIKSVDTTGTLKPFYFPDSETPAQDQAYEFLDYNAYNVQLQYGMSV